MRETVGSLRAYFIIAGVVVSLLATIRLAIVEPIASRIYGHQSALTNGSVYLLIYIVLSCIVSLILGIAFIVVGVRLPRLLKQSAQRIVALLYIWLTLNLLFFILGIPLGNTVLGLLYFAIAAIIVWYLLKNVRRLAGEVGKPQGLVP